LNFQMISVGAGVYSSKPSIPDISEDSLEISVVERRKFSHWSFAILRRSSQLLILFKRMNHCVGFGHFVCSLPPFVTVLPDDPTKGFHLFCISQRVRIMSGQEGIRFFSQQEGEKRRHDRFGSRVGIFLMTKI
jgi:hypothetical protein